VTAQKAAGGAGDWDDARDRATWENQARVGERHRWAAILEKRARDCYPDKEFPPMADDWHQAEGAARRQLLLTLAAELRAQQ
jgi:hypothetical protein